jgi:hypothetical protein
MHSTEVLDALPPRYASALATLGFSISEDPLADLPNLSRFASLRTLFIEIPGGVDRKIVALLVEEINSLPVLESLCFAMQGPWGRPHLNIDLHDLPSSLTTISLVTVNLAFTSVANLIRSTSREACKISWSEVEWKAKDQSKMDKLVGREAPLRQRYGLKGNSFELLEVSSRLGASSMRRFADLPPLQ